MRLFSFGDPSLSVFVVFCHVLIIGGAPNFVLVVTDDQDLLLNGLVPMSRSVRLIADKGAVFRNAFVNTPVCCPSRSTILTGKYLHNTHVYNNSAAGNCSSLFWQRNHEPFTIAAHLKQSNYTTFYAGKYLNQYGSKDNGGVKHVPFGYDWWIGLVGNSKYYDYTLSINGTGVKYENEYLTDVINNYSLQFLNQRIVREGNFFMMIAPPASHSPFTPAPRHEGKFPNATALRTPSFNYTSDDKHWLVRLKPNRLPPDVPILDKIHRGRLQTLLAVDEMIENIHLKLLEIGKLEETYIIFTSDNGFHIGQFTQPWDKRQPYETDVRVPFFMSGPSIKPKILIDATISLVDLMSTILDLAGVAIPEDTDGVSFKKYLSEDAEDDGRVVLIEYFGEGNENTVEKSCSVSYDRDLSECSQENWCKCQDSRNNTYACVRKLTKTTNFKFCSFKDSDNFVEAYDLNVDPYELVNIHRQLPQNEVNYYRNLLEKLSACKGIECRP